MNGPLMLLAHSVKRIRTLVLTMGLLLAAFQVLLVSVAGSIHRSGGFKQLATLLPPFARELMGPAVTSMMSFSGVVAVGYFHLAVMFSLIGLAITTGTAPASEVESGFMDLLLSRPLARHWIITRTIFTGVISALFVLALMVCGTWIGLNTLAPPAVPWPSFRLIRSLVVNLAALMWCWCGVSLAIASAARRRSVAGASAGLLALTAFLLDYLGRLWKPLDSIAWISPFRYYDPFQLLLGAALPARNIVVLITIGAAGFAAAYALFARRDISH